MTISLRSARLIMAAACVCSVLAVSPFARSQAAPTAAHQGKSVHPTPLEVAYDFDGLIEILGEENEHIQAQIQNGKVPVTPRRDYATLIGISKDEEETMLAIVFDAYQRGQSMDSQHHEEISELYSQYDQSDRDKLLSMAQESENALYNKRNAMLIATVAKLKSQLGEKSFEKLDKFLVSDEFRGPYVDGIKVDMDSLPDPCPPNSNPPPGQTTHLACARLYRNDVFMYIGQIDSQNKRAAAESESGSTKPERFVLFDHLPEDRRQAAFALGVEANRAISEIDERARTEGDGSGGKSATTLEEYIFKLKQVTGDEFFTNFDTYLSKKNKTIDVPPGGVSSAQQAPAVQQ